MKPARYAFRRLMLRNFRTLTLFIIPVLILSLLLILFQVRTARQEWEGENEAVLLKTAVNMDTLFAKTSADMRQTAFRTDVFSFFSIDRSRFSREYVLTYDQLHLHLQLLISRFDEADMVFLYSSDPMFYVTQGSAMSFPSGVFNWQSDPSNTTDPLKLLIELYTERSGARWLLWHGSLLYYHPLSLSTVRGGFGIRFSSQRLAGLLSSSLPSPQSRLLLVDEEDRIIASSLASDEIGSSLPFDPALPECRLNSETYTLSRYDSSVSGWRYLLLSPHTAFRSVLMPSVLFSLLLLTAFLLLCFLLVYVITRKTCRPYELILELLRIPDLSDEERTRLYETKYADMDELGMISTLIFRSHNEKTSLQLQVEKQKDLIRSAQRKALQAQINPHFLINTLEGVKWQLLELLPKDSKIPKTVSSLAQLLKANLELNAPMTTIGEEVHQARLYLQIQQDRYKGLFDVEWDVDPSLLSHETIRFTLQPLLENAINHGIKKAGHGSLFISVRAAEEVIRFVIRDSGAGIGPEELEALRLRLRDSRLTQDSGIGLSNVNTRLMLIFGSEYGLKIESRPGEGTTVTMDIPRVLPADMPGWIHEDTGL